MLGKSHDHLSIDMSFPASVKFAVLCHALQETVIDFVIPHLSTTRAVKFWKPVMPVVLGSFPASSTHRAHSLAKMRMTMFSTRDFTRVHHVGARALFWTRCMSICNIII